MPSPTAEAATASDAASLPAAEPVRSSARSRFFLGMAILLLAINLVGFAPTYFLKSFFDTPELPLRLHVHGMVFTAWFVFFVVQTSLIARGNVALHRRLGMAGAALAVLLVISGLSILHYRALRYSDPGVTLVGTTSIVWGNLALLSSFAAFVTLAIMFRRRPGAHKRLMLLASLAMMPQSLGRLGRFPMLRVSESTPLSEAVYGLGGLLALLAAMALHDLLSRRRLHPVTTWGVPMLLVTIIGAGIVLPNAGFAQSLILWLN